MNVSTMGQEIIDTVISKSVTQGIVDCNEKVIFSHLRQLWNENIRSESGLTPEMDRINHSPKRKIDDFVNLRLTEFVKPIGPVQGYAGKPLPLMARPYLLKRARMTTFSSAADIFPKVDQQSQLQVTTERAEQQRHQDVILGMKVLVDLKAVGQIGEVCEWPGHLVQITQVKYEKGSFLVRVRMEGGRFGGEIDAYWPCSYLRIASEHSVSLDSSSGVPVEHSALTGTASATSVSTQHSATTAEVSQRDGGMASLWNGGGSDSSRMLDDELFADLFADEENLDTFRPPSQSTSASSSSTTAIEVCATEPSSMLGVTARQLSETMKEAVGERLEVLATGQAVSSAQLQEVERYTAGLATNRPRFAMVPSALGRTQDALAAALRREVELCAEEDPFAPRPEPDLLVIGRLKKMTRAPTEFHVTLLDVYVRETRSSATPSDIDGSCETSIAEYIYPVMKLNLDVSELFVVTDFTRRTLAPRK